MESLAGWWRIVSLFQCAFAILATHTMLLYLLFFGGGGVMIGFPGAAGEGGL